MVNDDWKSVSKKVSWKVFHVFWQRSLPCTVIFLLVLMALGVKFIAMPMAGGFVFLFIIVVSFIAGYNSGYEVSMQSFYEALRESAMGNKNENQ